MSEDRMIWIAFLISFTGHCLFLGTQGFNLRSPQHEKQLQEFTVEVKIERPTLLPKIDTMGPKKKFKKVEQKLEQLKSERKPQIRPDQKPVQQVSQQRIEEKVDVPNPDKEATLRYQDMVKQKIEQSRMYPLWAKQQGIEGTTYLYFVVLPTGIGQDIKIIRPSGSTILDQEGVATIKRAQPFPPVPKEISRSSLGMEVAIVFELKSETH